MSSRNTRMQYLIPYDPDLDKMENNLRAVMDDIVDENAYYKNGRRHFRMIKVGQSFQDLLHIRPNNPYQYSDTAFRRSYGVVGGIPNDAEGIRLENRLMRMLTEEYGICLNSNSGGLPRKMGDEVYSRHRPGALYMVVAKMKIKSCDDLKEACPGYYGRRLGLGMGLREAGLSAYDLGVSKFDFGTANMTPSTSAPRRS